MGFFTRPIETDSNDAVVAVPFRTPRPLTASASKINLNDKKELDMLQRRRAADKWQEEAWDYYDLITEIKFAANVISNALSRINIYAGYIVDSSSVPSRIDIVDHLDEDFKEKANASLFLLESGNGGTSGILKDAALNLFVVGECYLVKEPAKFSTGEGERWNIRSIDEIVKITKNKQTTLCIKPRRDSPQTDYKPLTKGSYIARIWRNHPRYSDEADSSLRGVLDLCDELLMLSRAAGNTAKSRLNAGLVFIPDGISHSMQGGAEFVDPEDPDADLEPLQDESDNVEESLSDALINPIADPGSASAVMPVLLRGEESLGEKIRFIKFERSFDPQLNKRAETVLSRIITGLDIPKDIVGGMASLKGTNAKVVEEAMYSSHIEPMVLMLCDALTVGFLRPALRAFKDEDGNALYRDDQIDRAVIWYDPSAITAKPSKSESANIGFKDNIISAEAWRRAHGFAKSDAPTQLEIAQKLAVAKGLISEPLAEKLIATLIPDLMEGLRAEQLQQSDPTSADALNNALSTEPVVPTDTIEPAQSQAPAAPAKQAPSTLLEP